MTHKQKCAQSILKISTKPASIHDTDGRTPFHYACCSFSSSSKSHSITTTRSVMEFLSQLLSAYPPAVTSADLEGYIPLHYAAFNMRIVMPSSSEVGEGWDWNGLFEEKNDDDDDDGSSWIPPSFVDTPLEKPPESRLFSTASLLLRMLSSLHCDRSNEMNEGKGRIISLTPLHLACQSMRDHYVKLISSSGAQPIKATEPTKDRGEYGIDASAFAALFSLIRSDPHSVASSSSTQPTQDDSNNSDIKSQNETPFSIICDLYCSTLDDHSTSSLFNDKTRKELREEVMRIVLTMADTIVFTKNKKKNAASKGSYPFLHTFLMAIRFHDDNVRDDHTTSVFERVALDVLEQFPDQALQKDCHGNYPLHIACSIPHHHLYHHNKNHYDHNASPGRNIPTFPNKPSLIEALVRAYPPAARIPTVLEEEEEKNNTMALPLHLATMNGISWDQGGVRSLFGAYPGAMCNRLIKIRDFENEKKDVDGGGGGGGKISQGMLLVPSILNLVGDDLGLGGLYTLIQSRPEILLGVGCDNML